MYQYEPTTQDLKDLREWLIKVPYLRHDFEDHMLATFYRGCKGSLEKTKQRIDAYCHARLKYPAFTTNVDLFGPALQKNLNIFSFTPMPKKTPDGGVVMIGYLKCCDPDEYDFAQICKNMYVSTKTMLEENTCGSARFTVIIDNKGITPRHMLKLSPGEVAASFTMFRIYPWRLLGFHLLNAPPGSDWILALAKSVLKAKMAQRIHFHRNEDDIFKWVPRDVLPLEYGGVGGSIEKLSVEFRKKIESYGTKFLEEEKELAKLDLLRPKSDDIHVGSFRKLEID